MRNRIILSLASACFVILATCSPSNADEPKLRKRLLYILDTTVSTQFMPNELLFLFERSPGTSASTSAVASLTTQSLSDQEQVITIASTLPSAQVERLPAGVRGTFVAFGDKTAFASSPVRTWTKKEALENSLSVKQLLDLSAELGQKILLAKLEYAEIQKHLESLREAASVTAGVDGIIDLKLSLAKIQVVSAEKQIEIARLQKLLDQSRSLQDPEDILSRQQELLMQLKEVAQTTATAEKLTQKKKALATSEFDQKIGLVQAMQAYDAERLAQDILRLRAERKQLETSLRPNVEPSRDF